MNAYFDGDWDLAKKYYNDHPLVQYCCEKKTKLIVQRYSIAGNENYIFSVAASSISVKVDNFKWISIGPELLDFVWQQIQVCLTRKEKQDQPKEQPKEQEDKKEETEQKQEKKQEEQKKEEQTEKKEFVSVHAKPQFSKEKLEEIKLISEKICRAISLLNESKQSPCLYCSSVTGFMSLVPIAEEKKIQDLLISLLEFCSQVTIQCKGTDSRSIEYVLLGIILSRQ